MTASHRGDGVIASTSQSDALNAPIRFGGWLFWLPAMYLALCVCGGAQTQMASLSPAAGTYSPGQQVTFTMYGYGADNWQSANDYLVFEATQDSSGFLDMTGVCQIQYQPYTYTVYLTLDNGTSFASGAVGANVVLSNSTCSVNLAGSSGSVTGYSTNATVTLPVTFTSQFTGTQYLYVARWILPQGPITYYQGSIVVSSSSQVAAPILSPGEGNYPSLPSVSMLSATSGAAIRYTTDGSTPTETSGTVYTGPVTLSGNGTLKAIAYKGGLTDSAITSAAYTTGQPSLPSDLTVTSATLSGTYAAVNTITTSGSVTAPSGSSVTFQAGAKISLEPGFHAANGSSFQAVLSSYGGSGGPDFMLSASPTTSTITTGSPITYNLTATALAGFTGSVQLSPSTVYGIPAGATVTFGTTTLTPSSGTSSTTATISTSNQGQAGSFTPAVTGISGSLAHSAHFGLTVNPLGAVDFTLSVSPPTQTIQLGATATYTIQVAPQNGFSGDVALGLSGLPAGVNFVITPSPIRGGSGSSTLSVYTSNGGPTGTFSLTVTAASGPLSHSAAVSLTVNGPVTETITTVPPSLQISDNGTVFTAPQTFQWTGSSGHTIATTSPQGSSGTQYLFASWSDGGGISHTVFPTNSSVTYTANFTTQYQLTTVASPANEGTVTPAGTAWYNSGASVQVSATPNAGYQFNGFTGALTGTTTPQSLTMTGPLTVTANFAPIGAPPPTYTISGTLTQLGVAMQGITVNLSGSQTSQVTTDAGGNYSFPGLAAGNYTVTPQSTMYTFCPQSTSFNSLAASQTSNFTGGAAREYIRLGSRVIAIATCGAP